MAILPQLPVKIEALIIANLPRNEVACTIRLVNKAAGQCYRDPQHVTVRLSQPVPQHAFEERCEAYEKEWLRALPYKKRLQLLCLTAASGDLTNLEVAVRAAGCVLTGTVMEAAAAAGHIHVCQRLRQLGCPWGSALASAAGAGWREVCERLLASGCPMESPLYIAESALYGAIHAAVKGGHMDISKWLQQRLSKGPPAHPSFELVAAAACGCDLPTLQRLHLARQNAWRQLGQRQPVGELTLTLEAAAGSSTPDWRDKVEWLEGNGRRRSTLACRRAASRPDAVDRLRWLRKRGYPLDRHSVWAAARKGNVAALQYLLVEAGVQADTRTVDEAAANGHLAALQALHADGFRIDTAACLKSAAAAGHLAVVVWLVDTFEPSVADLQAGTARAAVRSGSIELLCWLAERGCDFTPQEEVMEEAATGGCENAVEWLLVERGCCWPQGEGAPYIAAARNGDLATLACLRRLGCPWGTGNDFLTECIKAYGWSCQRLPVLRWLVEAGCPVDWGAALKAAGERDGTEWAEVAAWLLEEQKRRTAGSS